jgi:predicted DCC family thiol-disulfide oxidoreductase YuxK
MILFYDDECTLCRRFKQAISLLDKEKLITYRPIQDESIYTEFSQLNPDACAEDVHLLDGEKLLVGAEVVEHLAKSLPGVRKFSWLIEKESAQTALDLFYGQISDMRKMQKKKCFRCGSKSRKRTYTEREL